MNYKKRDVKAHEIAASLRKTEPNWRPNSLKTKVYSECFKAFRL
jgi:hypothetical protein